MFAVEIPICLGTCLLWLFAPAEYLGGFLGKRPHDVADYLLLQQSTAVVFSMFVYFYGRVLLSRRIDLHGARQEVWAQWSSVFQPGGELVGRLFGRRVQQLALPARPLDVAHGMDSRVVHLIDASGEQHAGRLHAGSHR